MLENVLIMVTAAVALKIKSPNNTIIKRNK